MTKPSNLGLCRNPWRLSRGTPVLAWGLACFILLLGSLSPSRAWASNAKNVLVLNSYHPTYVWTNNIVEGIKNVLGPLPDVELSVDYMDTKKLYTPQYAEQLAQLYSLKYAKLRFDVIISTDDDALNFLLKYRDDVFPKVPVVFAGVNNFEDSRLAGYSGYTGVNEANDIRRNLDWLAQTRPLTRRLFIVHDQSATGLAMAKQLRSVEYQYRSRFSFEYVTSVTQRELEDRVRALPQDGAIYWGVFMRDQAGEPLSPKQSIGLIVRAASVPVFSFWDFAVIEGAVGGYVVSGRHQGETAGLLAQQLLSGVPLAAVPIVRQSPNVFMFDHRALVRWRIDPDRLPADAVVLNRPFSFYETYKSYVWAALGGMGVESLAILVLLGMIRTITRKSRAKLRESDERYRSIVEDGTEYIGRVAPNGQWQFVNGALARRCNLDAGNLTGESFWSLVPTQEQTTFRNAIQSITDGASTCTIEHRLEMSSLQTVWLNWTCRGLVDEHGTVSEFQLVGRDITARKEAEDALRDALAHVEKGNLALQEANGNLQGVLDGMREALFVCALDGTITPIRSRATLEWFGVPQAGVPVWDYLAAEQSAQQRAFRIGFEQLSEDLMPFEVNAAQMPATLRKGERTFRFDYQQVVCGEKFSAVLFIATDVTAQICRERAERLNRELPVIVGHMLRDRVGFQDFVADTEHALGRIATVESGAEQRRILHTLKGNTALYGLSHFSEHCHAIEDRIANDPREPTTESIELLVETWEESLASVGVFLTHDPDETVQIARKEYDELLNRIASNDDYLRLLQTARTWVHPPLAKILELQVTSARQLARRFGKEVQTEVLDHGLRLPAGSLRGFFSALVHVIRNAVDHGIEDPIARLAAGKPRTGRLTIETRIADGAFRVVVADDGRGIDWERVRARAARMQLPSATEQDLVNALGVDGLTTNEAVTDVSGRGVGMSAVYRACTELGGHFKVISTCGSGTRFEFSFPFDAIKHSLLPAKETQTDSGIHRTAPPVAIAKSY